MDYEGSENAGSETTAIDVAALIGATAEAVARTGATPLVADANNVIALPQGASLDDIKVVGRDLVITLDDGRTFIIANGAVSVPIIVIDGVAVPPLNLAALLTSNDPQPAAGPVNSSGGNFADPVDPLQPAYGLGDLLPYTELAFPEPPREEVIPEKPDRQPDVVIVDGQPASKNAVDNVSEVGLPGTRANGNVEAPGTSAGNGSDSTTGTIIITSPDGIASVTINGTTYTGAGQVITTPRGTLTLGGLNAAGEIPYTYRLTDNTAGDATTDLFTVIVTDPDGDTSTATLTVEIADDVPTARNDTDAVAGGTFGPESGNVMSGTGTTSGSAGADTQGADGAAVSGFRAGSAGTFAAIGSTINGQYGTLTLGANGTYTYVRNGNTPGGVNDVFSYQLTDGDGDTSTATLTIAIGDSPAVITFVPDIGDGTVVREAQLPARGGEPAGSQFDGDIETTTGTITFTSPDGVGSVTIAGTTINPAALPQQVSSDATGTLVINAYSYDPVTGVGSITYTYTLNDNTLNTNGSIVTFPITVTDLDGDTASDTLDITIIDDAPVAVNDTDSLAAGQYGPATGNVITDAAAGDVGDTDTGADTRGADGAAVTAVTGAAAGTIGGTTAGAYGTLTLNADGSYSYTRNAGSPGGVTDTFTYTLTDGDGDARTATLTITIDDATPATGANADAQLDDDALAGGNPGGTDDDANAVNVTGTLAGSGGDGPLTWAFTSPTLPAGFTSESPAAGTLLIKQGTTVVLTVTLNTADGTYSVVQNAPIIHPAGSDENNHEFTIGYSVSDVDGDSAPGSIVVNVDDDTPTAVDDTARSVAEDAVGSISGNVMGNDTQGADSAVMTSVVVNGVPVAVALVGTTNYSNANGAYTFTAAGAWTFDPAPGLSNNVTPVDASFTYTITDGDGDPSSAVQPISVTDGAPPSGGDTASLSVDDQNLGDGSTPGAVTSNDTINFTAGSDPIATIAFSADLSLLDASLTWTHSANQIVGKLGGVPIVTLDLVRVGDNASVTLTLNDNYALHAGLNADDLKALGSVQVIATDSDGDTATGTVSLSVSDDVPLARADIDSVTEDGPLVADGNVITASGGIDLNITDGVADTKGADGAAVSAVAFGATNGTVGTALAGNYGSLTLNANGTYSYALNNALPSVQGLDGNDTLTEVFTYTIKDGDNDTSTTTLTVTINGSDDPITIDGLNVGAPEEIVDEDDLLDGSSPDAGALTQTGSFTVNGVDGIAGITIEGGAVAVNQTFSTAYGTFKITSVSGPVDGSQTSITIGYSYELTDSTATHATANGENFLTEVFDIAVTDTDGSTDTDTVEVRIIDDVPTARDDTANQDVENTPVVINAFTNDTFGADGVDTDNNPAVAVTFTQPPVGEGSVSYNPATGLFTFTQVPGQVGSTSFTYTIKDGDGDVSTATVTINLLTDSVPTVSVTDTTVNEDGLPARGLEAAGSSTGSNSHVGNGTFTITTGGDTLQVLEVQDKNGAWINVTAGGSVAGNNGTLVVTLSAGTYSYTYTLDDNLENHPDNVTGDLDGISDAADPLAGEAFAVRATDNDGSVSLTDTLNVTVLDDAPTAVDDTARSVAEDAVGSIGGNVMGNDTLGADSAVMTSVVVNGVPVAVALVGTTNYSNANGAYTFTAAGAWTFDPAPGLSNNVTPVDASFTYTITDGDGDPSSAVQPISVTDGAPPSGGDTASLSVDDQNLGDGSTPGAVTSNDTINFTAGSDPIATIAFSADLSLLDASLTWTHSANQIVGKLGGVPIVTLDLVRVGDNASVTLTLNDNYALHAGLNADDLKALGSVQVIATDSDGDTATGTVSLSVSDDLPDVTATSPANNDLSVDETLLGVDDTADFSTLFTKNYYADGQASVDPLLYELGVSAPGANSGLIDVATGNQILLRAVGGVVEGYLSGNTAVVAFTVSISTSGIATLDQIRALQHPTNPDQNEPIGLASAGLITLKATIKDGDGDTDSATVNIGNALQFRDDGPSIDGVATDPATILATQDAETDGIPTAQDTASADFSTAFSVLTSNYGADNAGTTTWAYSLNLKVVAGSASGLSSDGQPITMHVNAGVIEGRVGATVIFSIAVNAGSGLVTVTQFAEIDHAAELDTTAPFDDQFAALANGLVDLVGTVTIVDRDGDSISDTANLDLGGNIRFHDDGPAAVADTNTVVEGAIINGNVLLDGADDAFGADGAFVTIPAGGVVGVAAGSNTATPVSGGLGVAIETALGFLTLNANGTYTYDAKPNTTSTTVTDTFVYTIKDGDGDTSTTTLTITVTPVTLVADNETVLVNEAALDTTISGSDVAAGTTTGSQPSLTSETATGTLVVPGATAFAISGSGIGIYGTLVINPTTGAYTYTLRNAFDTTPDNDNSTQTELGVEQFTYTATDANGNSITGTVTVNVIDDVPSVTATLNAGATVSVDESGPSVVAAIDTLAVVKGDDPDLAGSNALARSTSGTAVIGETINYGADGAAAAGAKLYSLSVVNGSASGLTLTNGTGINLQLLANGTVVGVVATGPLAGQAAFAVAINATSGVVTVEQYLSIQHGNASDPNDPATMTANAIKAVVTVKDGDGDTDASNAVDISGQITFRDDGPSITVDANVATITVDETNLAAGAATIALSTFTQGADIDKGIGVTVTTSAPTVMSTVSASSYGVDGQGVPNISYALSLAGGANSAATLLTTTGGVAITLVKVSDTVVVGRVGATNTVAFAIEVDATNGAVKVEQYLSLFHPNAANPNDPVSLAAGDLSIIGTIKDGDGDTFSDPAAIGNRITFSDDGPSVLASGNITLTGSNLSGSGTFDYSIGADGRTTFSAADTDLAVVLSGTVGTGAITSTDVDWFAEDASTATFNFSFNYDSDPTDPGNALTPETGKIVFDKVAGTYTVTLDQPIATYSTSLTSSTISSTGYDTAGGPQTEVVVSLLSNSPPLYVQFSGFEETSGGGGVSLSSGGNTAYTNGETLTAAQTYVSISGSANGVASDTIQRGEVLDMDFFSTDPGSNTALATNTFATGMFLKIDNFGSEDLVVILKLADPNNPGVVLTTRAIVVDTGDVFTQATGVPAGYNVTLDSNDGLIVIETNDYRATADPVQYVIVGAQLLSSTEGITGTGVNLDGAVGAGGASTTAGVLDSQAFGPATVDTDVVKISDIGIIRPITSTQTVHLNFDVIVTDDDGDATTTTRLSVNPVVPPIALDLDGDGVEFIAASVGVTFDYLGNGSEVSTAWVGKDDGLLAIDLNSDGQVNNGSEIVFGGNGLSDLAGLAANYDSNSDGQLSAGDTAFAKFGVWNDANSNGDTDAGEFRSLLDMGITSISLTSDGKSYEAAGGDVLVQGSAAFTYANGSTGVLADASFAIERQAREATSVSTTALVAATTAMVFAPAAAADAPLSVTMGNDGFGSASPDFMATFSYAATMDTGFRSESLFGAFDMHLAGAPLSDNGFQHEMIAAESLELVNFGQDMVAVLSAGDEQGFMGSHDASAFLFGHGGPAMQAMDALLIMPQVAAANDSAGLGDLGQLVAGAMEDVRDVAFVEALLDRLGATDLGAVNLAADGHQGFAETLLNLEIGGETFAQFHHSAAANQLTDEHAALASASV